MKIALVAAIALIWPALAPQASAGLSDTEIAAGYCLAVVTAQIPVADKIDALRQQSIGSWETSIASLEKSIVRLEKSISSYEQIHRVRPLSESEETSYYGLKNLLNLDRETLSMYQRFLY